MSTSDIRIALKRYVAQGSQVGPYGAPDARHYRIDEKYALPYLANALGLTREDARRELAKLAEQVGAGEVETAYRFWVCPVGVIDSAND